MKNNITQYYIQPGPKNVIEWLCNANHFTIEYIHVTAVYNDVIFKWCPIILSPFPGVSIAKLFKSHLSAHAISDIISLLFFASYSFFI
jgi:hypothetical protein